jgi:outer membrane lipoprotein SlyB
LQSLGADEGPADGTRLEVLLGPADARAVGATVGPAEGTLLGATVGPVEGALLGPVVGPAVVSAVVTDGSPPLQQAKDMV